MKLFVPYCLEIPYLSLGGVTFYKRKESYLYIHL
jgi:hypothetical protein